MNIEELYFVSSRSRINNTACSSNSNVGTAMFSIYCYLCWPPPPLEIEAFKKCNLHQEIWALIFIAAKTSHTRILPSLIVYVCLYFNKICCLVHVWHTFKVEASKYRQNYGESLYSGAEVRMCTSVDSAYYHKFLYLYLYLYSCKDSLRSTGLACALPS